MATTTLVCKRCGKEFQKENKEINRQLKKGITSFFCDSICAALYNNISRIVEAEKICKHCKKPFTVKISNKKTDNTFCSRSCASAGSVTDLRKLKARESGLLNCKSNFDINEIAKGLRSREGWKYVDIEKFLSSLNVEHIFEFIIENYIYDLALINKKIIFEFDGDNHIYDVNEIAKDKLKEKLANENGWQVVRISVENSTKIKPSLLIQYIESSSRKSEY